MWSNAQAVRLPAGQWLMRLKAVRASLARMNSTLDSSGLRPYGEKGLRIYDFGWQQVPKG
jgi:hypothetical protein